MIALIRYQIELFFTALEFFTRIPIPARIPWSEERLNHAARYFPLTGWVVGAVAAGVYLLGVLILPASLAVLLSMAATIRLTGAFHEDGWADTCDALGGGMDKAQTLRIMKDSRIGSYGAIGLVLMLMAKAVVLIELSALGHLPVVLALLAVHPLSRLASTGLIHVLEYVREDAESKSKPLARRLTQRELAIAGIGGLLPLLLLPPVVAGAALLAATLVALWAARRLVRRLGGYTGDGLGATQQGAELMSYLGILIAWPLTL